MHAHIRLGDMPGHAHLHALAYSLWADYSVSHGYVIKDCLFIQSEGNRRLLALR